MGQLTKSALKLVVIALLSGAHVWRNCSAIPIPLELLTKGVLHLMTQHFCSSNGSYPEHFICWNLNHGVVSNRTSCYDITGQLCREVNQDWYCSYEDALVCRYTDGTGSCVYSNSSSISPFCFCRNSSGLFPTSVSPGYPIKSCSNDSTTVTSHLPTTTSAYRQPTTSDGLDNAGQSTVPHGQTKTADGRDNGDQVNVVAIVVGAVLFLIILLVIVVVICLCRRGNLKSMRKKPPKKEVESTSVELAKTASNREQLPEPLLINNIEYSYAYDHWPVSMRPANAANSTPVIHAQVGGQGSDRYVTDGPGCSSGENGPTTEAADAHPYSEPERRDGYEEVKPDKSSGSATGVAANSSTGHSPKEADDNAYFQVYPTRESLRSHDETPGYEEVGVMGTDDGQDNGTSSPYQQLDRGTMERAAAYLELKGEGGGNGLTVDRESVMNDEEKIGAPTPYQHLNRATLKRINEDGRQKGNGNYEHLKGSAEYDVISPVGDKTTE